MASVTDPSTSPAVDDQRQQATPSTVPALRVAPSQDDPVVNAASALIGGPAGRRRSGSRSWWTPLRILLVLGFLSMSLAVVSKVHCYDNGWLAQDPDKYVHQCYSDIPMLYYVRGLKDGKFPYFSDLDKTQQVEYPVLTGLLMGVTSLVVPETDNSVTLSQRYYDVNVIILALCFFGLIVATARTVRHRPWDAALVALSPLIILTGTINWDLFAAVFTGFFLWAWARKKPVLAGVMLGIAIAAKFYPLILLGPLFLLCLRAQKLKAPLQCLGATVGTWLAINLPFFILAREEWLRFYKFSQERGVGYSSIWFVLNKQNAGIPESGESLNMMTGGSFLAACALIGLLIILARRRPRLAQVSFLVVAAFVLTNKVYSPQFIVWLIPLAAMARPRWRDMLIWQLAEAIHFVAVWLYIIGVVTPDHGSRTIGIDGYTVAVGVHILATMWFMGLVVRDILSPRHDPVRADGSDDPGGGVLDGIVDRDHRAEPMAIHTPEGLRWSLPGAASDKVSNDEPSRQVRPPAP